MGIGPRRSAAVPASCSWCRKKKDCWEVPWSTWAGKPHCAECWEFYEDWIFSDLDAVCGMVPVGDNMTKLRPVGLVAIEVFRVGPNAGNHRHEHCSSCRGL